MADEQQSPNAVCPYCNTDPALISCRPMQLGPFVVQVMYCGTPEGALKTTQAHVREIVFPVLGSRYFVETAGDSKAAVGQNYQFLHATECSRWKGNVKQTFSTLATHQVGNFQESYIESRPLAIPDIFTTSGNRPRS